MIDAVVVAFVESLAHTRKNWRIIFFLLLPCSCGRYTYGQEHQQISCLESLALVEHPGLCWPDETRSLDRADSILRGRRGAGEANRKVCHWMACSVDRNLARCSKGWSSLNGLPPQTDFKTWTQINIQVKRIRDRCARETKWCFTGNWPSKIKSSAHWTLHCDWIARQVDNNLRDPVEILRKYSAIICFRLSFRSGRFIL